MGKIKALLKIDSSLLRDTLSFLLSSTAGIYGFFYQIDPTSKLKGVFFSIISIVFLISIIAEFKRVIKILNSKI